MNMLADKFLLKSTAPILVLLNLNSALKAQQLHYVIKFWLMYARELQLVLARVRESVHLAQKKLKQSEHPQWSEVMGM